MSDTAGTPMVRLPRFRAHRARRLTSLLAAVALTACLDIASPTDDVESISALIVPFPAVVVGDTLRDSLGVARRLDVVAFTGRGDTVRDPEGLRFFLPDTGSVVRIEDGYVIAGDSVGTARVVAQVPGLQTPPVTIQVVAPPTRVSADPPSTADTVRLAAKEYDLELTVTSDPLQVRVRGELAGTTRDLNGWLVRYVITRLPASVSPTVPVAYLADDRGRAVRGDSLRATDTTAAGVAARRVVLRPDFLPVQSGRIDTVIVEARAFYRGLPVAGSPVIFGVPFAQAP